LKTTLVILGLLAAPHLATAHGDAAHAAGRPQTLSTERHAWGVQGDAKRSKKIVHVTMGDDMRFRPAHITVRRGQTVTFVARNEGRTMHEFVIGTLPALTEHAELMKKFPGMEHDQPYMAHVAPGRTQRIHWTFTDAGTFHAGCLIPGHWEAGMKATITVKE
jgi:uncharacterized cupredoxin-like copper-binding protein